MSTHKIFSAPKSLELENFIFNPIAVINVCPTIYLIYRDEHELKDAMKKFANVQKDDLVTQKLVPKDFQLNSKDGKLFRQKNEEKAVLVTKVTTYQLKIMSLMDELVRMLNKPPTFIDSIDQFKQRKLFADFIARFSRNYIYEVDRIIEEIQFYQVDHYSYFERSTNHLVGKVCNLFAVIMRAFQTYQKQLAKMNNENSEKLLHFIELIVSGINVSIELKIFDEDDLLIKLLLEKTDEFIAFLRMAIFDESPLERPVTKPPIAAASAEDVYIPTTNRYVMYAPKLKKAKPSKSTTALSKTNRSGKCLSRVNQQPSKCDQETGKIQTMFESHVCSGESSTCDAYEEAIKQKQANGQDIDVNCCTLSESDDENEIQVETPSETEVAKIGSFSELLNFDLEF